ncbi:MAG: hypothetical protein QM767_27450 [Anaeromyxobacter sp.]
MLYFFPDAWVRSGHGTRANEVLSEVDKAFISGEGAYPGRSAAAVPLTVGGDPVSARIGAPGEEDLFQFVADHEGRHVVETTGRTDVVLRLYGPNDPTHLVAEDDDGGAGLNSRIVADLVPGKYMAQIRHYNTRRGTGSYRIGVSG